MFKTCIASSKLTDRKLYQYVQGTFIGIIEIEALEYLNTWNRTDPLDEYLDSISPCFYSTQSSKSATDNI